MGPPRVVVMGVSGCGKSTVGQGLAQVLGVPYLEGDELHPARNVERMRAGIALTDEDRRGWLEAIAERLSGPDAQARGLVVSCSALKRSYRDLLRGATPELRFVHLHGDPALLAQRMAQRQGHYMPPSLLQSQLQTLEVPAADEHVVSLDIATPVSTQIEDAARQLRTS